MVRLVRSKIGLARRWMSSLPPVFAIGLLLVIAVFALTGMYGSYRLYSYTQDDPVFCRSCHTMEKAWDLWSTSVHNQVNCHNCHESNPVESLQQVVEYATTQPNQVSKKANVSDEACKKCHETNDPQWTQVASTAGHKVHAEVNGISCLKCHSTSLHQFEPPKDICLTCHSDKRAKMTNMTGLSCTDCHNFNRNGGSLLPTRQDCLDCHQKQGSKEASWPTDAPMQLECSQCHQTHKQAQPQASCQTCHQGQENKGKHSVAAHQAAGCTTCHQPHEWKVTERDTCTTCHKDKVQHNQGAFCGSCHSFS